MTMDGVNTRKIRSNRSRKKPEAEPSKSGTKTLNAKVSGATDPVTAEAEYQRILAGWDDLPAATRERIIRRTVALNNMPVPPRMAAAEVSGGVLTLTAHPDQHETDFTLGLSETFGGHSMEFANARMGELAAWFVGGTNPRGTAGDVSAGLAFVNSVAPQNHVEAQMATQMVLTNSAALKMLILADASNILDQKQVLGNLAVKMMRTFTMQAEALSKLQRGGEQVVKHVHIDNRGGQAVVTEKVVTGGSNSNAAEQPYGTDLSSLRPALLGPDPLGNGMPIACGEEQAAVSHPRWAEPRRAEG